MTITFEEIRKVNEEIRTMTISRKDKYGRVSEKEYAEVNQRVKAFRMLYPEGAITTDIIEMSNGIVTIKATIMDSQGNILATGTAQEKEDSSYINNTSYIENCETSAVGRALGFCGLGIDCSIASAEEVANAMAQQDANKPVTKAEKQGLIESAQAKGLVVTDILQELGWKEGETITRAQYGKAMERIIKAK